VGNRARDRLPDPPRGVGRELVAAAVFELVDRLHQADVAFLDEVEELQAAVRVLLREMTEANLRLVISRFARRALASPVDICLLISLRSFSGMPILFWIARSFCCCSRMFGSKRPSWPLQGLAAAISFFTQRMLVS